MITARKQSLAQGNVFTSVCQSFCSQGEGSLSGCLPDRDPLDRYPPYGKERTVRILLECIFVLTIVFPMFADFFKSPLAKQSTGRKHWQVSRVVHLRKLLYVCFALYIVNTATYLCSIISRLYNLDFTRDFFFMNKRNFRALLGK